MTLSLFEPVVPVERFHPLMQLLSLEENGPERDVIQSWANEFVDRDKKFVSEFQLTFESSFWELYLHAYLRELGCEIDFGFHAPDFVVQSPHQMMLEAAIASPERGGAPAYGWNLASIPHDFTEFNIQATLRVCNAFDAKYRKYLSSYKAPAVLADRPYVIGIGAFDRPGSHMAAGRSILAALYGLYYDEHQTPVGATRVAQFSVEAAPKPSGASVPVGLFCDDKYADVSAVVYSALATWGKVRALAKRKGAPMLFSTLHPNPGHLEATRRVASKDDYREHLLDGLFVLHNPHAKRPIPRGVLSHPRIAEYRVEADGRLEETFPEDFLLVRMVNTITSNPDGLPVALRPKR